MKRFVSQERVRQLLDYNPETGVFTWMVDRRGTARAGGIAGSPTTGRYTVIGIDGVLFRAHRLAWLLSYGYMPDQFIDHINGEPSDNRISNLREATPGQNQQNMKSAKSNSRSGVLGVGWHPTDEKWRARIRVDGKLIFIGNFDTKEAAEAAYVAKKREIHPFGTM